MDLQKKPLSAALMYVFLTACGQSNGEKAADLEQPVAPIEVDSKVSNITTLSDAKRELRGINPEFRRELVQVADNVHVATGYAASIFTFIEGEDGVILIDAGQLPAASAEALAAYREISKKPITAIIFTHSHGDHINGAPAFVENASDALEVWGLENFGSETASFRGGGIRINAVRGARQAGFKLPPEKRINNGIAPAVYPSRNSFNPAGAIQLTHSFAGRKEIEVSGVNLVLVENIGETSDQIYVWYPDKKIAFAGDNFYKSWPNLYAIRGTPYRDVKAWIKAIDNLRSLNADVLVGGHTRPIMGAEEVRKTLTTYFDGVSHVFDKTIEGINLGLGPDELVEFAKLPPELANERVLRPYYGNPDWAVRSIFTGYLGWYDGNPTNLFPLPPKEEAQRMVDLAGGRDAFEEQLTKAIKTRDFQWATQLADYFLALEPENTGAMLMKATALDHLADTKVTALARNYYLTSAQELRARAKTIQDQN